MLLHPNTCWVLAAVSGRWLNDAPVTILIDSAREF
jgi:hypothetical protein